MLLNVFLDHHQTVRVNALVCFLKSKVQGSDALNALVLAVVMPKRLVTVSERHSTEVTLLF